MLVLLHPKAARSLEKFDKSVREKIKRKLKELTKNPRKGKLLKPTNFRSLRIGEYRAIYEIQNSKIVVLFIGHRKRVYEDFSRVLFFLLI